MAGENILVVDDGQENRDFVVEYVLQPNGYQAMVARDGREGLELAIKYRPDLILLDLQMPRMTGIQVLQQLAARKMDIPVILMTFHGSEEIAIEVYRMGVRDYLKKPFSIDEMIDAIERSLTEVRLQREKEALMERVIQSNRELQMRVQEMNVLYSVGKSVTATLDIDNLLPRIVDAAVQVTHAEVGQIYLITPDNTLVCRALKRQGDNHTQAINIVIRDRAALQVMETGKPLVLTPEQLNHNHDGPISMAYAPLVFRNRVLGILGVSTVSSEGHIFTKHDSALLSTLSDYAAISIENSRNFAELRAAKERENAQLRGTFEKLVPPSVVNRILSNPDSLELG
ncbi:MAG: response regulator, partial [Anaerolineae bacterium]|nr:response regulator [Anaerolineae bacterium]